MKKPNRKKVATFGGIVMALHSLFAPMLAAQDTYKEMYKQRNITWESDYYKELCSEGVSTYAIDKPWGFLEITTPQGDQLIDDGNDGVMDRGFRLYKCGHFSADWARIKPDTLHECGLTYGEIYKKFREKMKIPTGDLSRLSEKNIVPYAGRNR